MHHSILGARPARRDCVAIAFIVALAAPAAAEPFRLRLANGIDATIHTAESILRERTTRTGDRLFFDAAPGLRYELVTDTSDPIIANKGDGQFHPMPVDAVIAALEAVQLRDLGLQIEIFVLPYPRREIVDSSAREGMILLSPGVRPLSDYAVHFTVTHEVGHVYQYRWLPDSDLAGWDRYNGLRSLGDADTYHARAAHENRPHEVFAEDFRYLFGGDTSNYSGSIENAALSLPDEIAGLEEYLRGLCTVRRSEAGVAHVAAGPSPFHPETEIRVQFTSLQVPERASLRVLDAHGREVRRLFDGVPMARLLRVAWDGRDQLGSRLASGLYFAHLDCPGATSSSNLVLLP